MTVDQELVTVITQQSGNGAACPASVKCVAGDGAIPPGTRRRLVAFTDSTPTFPAKCQLQDAANGLVLAAPVPPSTISATVIKPMCYVKDTCKGAVAATNGGGKYQFCDAVDATSAKITVKSEKAQKVN